MHFLGELDDIVYFTFLWSVTVIYDIYCSDIECMVESDPAVFGRPLDILCRKLNTPENCVKNKTRSWMGGEKYPPLMIDGFPFNTSRYTEQVRSCSDFSLRIDKFTERDLNREYSCSIDFDKCPLHLSLSSANFEYHPSSKSTESNITLTSKSVNLSVNIPKVYPKPNFTVLYNGIIIDQSLTQTSNHVGLFFSTTLHLNYTFPSKTCPVKVDVNCLVGSTHFPILSEEFHNCTNHPSNQSTESNITLTSKSVNLSVYIPNVYPKPNCTAIYNGIIINQSLTQTSNHVGLFFSTKLHLNYTFPSEICPVKVDVNCLVGSTYFLILSEEFHNCTNNDEISSGFTGILLIVSFIVTCCMILVFGSLIRNWKKISEMLPDLPQRKFKDWRRPILGLLTTASLIFFLLYLEITTVSNVQRIHEKLELISPVATVCILMTPLSLSCISNPDTISIRKGMKKAWNRFIEKFKATRQNSSNTDTKENQEDGNLLNNASSGQSQRQKQDEEEFFV